MRKLKNDESHMTGGKSNESQKRPLFRLPALGTRMLPATKVNSERNAAPCGYAQCLQYLVEEAVASGIEDILIITNRSKSAIDDYFDYTILTLRLGRQRRQAKAKELGIVRHAC